MFSRSILRKLVPIIVVFLPCAKPDTDSVLKSVSTVDAETTFGPVEGDVVEVPGIDGKFSLYRGIRFAQKPLRFQAPVEQERSTKVQQAKLWPPPCVQWRDPPAQPKDTETEDCLFLNVIAPNKTSDDESGYPVMLWVHGGVFQFGDTSSFKAVPTIRNLVSKGIVFVSAQYRLGPLGFLSTGDATSAGNWALLDLTLALKWVAGNIKNFGGNPRSVTVFGESAGATIVGLLSLSPLSRGMFHRSILMSNANQLTDFAISKNPLAGAQRLASNLNCPTSPSSHLVDCLRQKPIADMREAYLKNKPSMVRADSENRPVIDGYFLPKPVSLLYDEMPKQPAIIGICGMEGGAKALIMRPTQQLPGKFLFPASLSGFTYEVFDSMINESVPESQFRNTALLRRLATHHYLEGGDKKNISFVFQQYIRLLSDVRFSLSAFMDSAERVRRGHNIWLYSFDYYNQAQFLPENKFRGAYHASDLGYIFDSHLAQFNTNEEDKRMTNIFSDFFINFAKTGEPANANQSGLVWNKLTADGPVDYLKLNLNPEMAHGFARSEAQFWLEVVPEMEQLQLKESNANSGGTTIADPSLRVITAISLVLASKNSGVQI